MHLHYPNINIEKSIPAFIEHLQSNKPKYHITITFQSNANQQEAISALNALLKIVNHTYFNHKTNEYLAGYSFKETKEDKSFHFHLLIFDHKAFYATRNISKNFENVLRNAANRIVDTYTTKNNQKVTYHPIHPELGIYFQEYYPGNLEDYLMKEARKTNNLDFISPLDHSGVSYADLPKDRPHRYIKHKLC